jgi:hypothetical protein
MKISLIALFPVLAAALLASLWLRRRSLREPLLALLLLAVVAGPWYAKNFLQTGDPVTPILNLSLRGADPFWSAHDVALAAEDLHSHEGGAVSRLLVPLDIVRAPDAWQFREYGVNLLFLCLGLPAAVAGFRLAHRGAPGEPALYALAAFVAYFIGLWLATTYIARYTLEFHAALAAVIAAVLVSATNTRPVLSWVAVAALVVLALPTSGGAQVYRQLWQVDNEYYRYFQDRESWLRPRAPGYPEMEYVYDAFRRARRMDLRVYRPQIETDRQFWAEHDITAVGDLFGPERYADFVHAVETNQVEQYIERFHLGAFVIPDYSDSRFTAEDQLRLDEELKARGFTKRLIPEGHRFTVYLSPAVAR